MTNPGIERFMAAVEKLPPYGGLVFRGLTDGVVVPPVGVLTGVVPASRDVRVATEDFTAASALAMLSRTGRDLSALSQQPGEGEVVFLPGTVWRIIAAVDLDGAKVHVVEELDLTGQAPPPTSWPPSLDELVGTVATTWRNHQALQPAGVISPGKFTGGWPAQPPAGG
ncbi:hypothetical protein [Cellulomonas bogoriensis]|uniref:Uncharacterized protein n=1 Tax=Cellulomonas bogoriensis 69B4 = DSM 16987 TaxID=1386082 RepID=A0A0A0BX04_9CELL|nr:hypothetical protein [Cellulomonas bogoriensis]KGM12505.1 hypothetical protein N869_14660 [Cellulomonas bogoriensis 69B4 = DSM 16987]